MDNVLAVDPDDLRRWWDFKRVACETWRTEHPGETGTVAFDPAAIANIAGASNPFAVWYRASFVEAIYRRGLLDQWLDAGQPNESVFRLAAVWPISDIEQFDTERFLGRLREG